MIIIYNIYLGNIFLIIAVIIKTFRMLIDVGNLEEIKIKALCIKALDYEFSDRCIVDSVLGKSSVNSD